MSKDTGGPAFPCSYNMFEGEPAKDFWGLSLRDYFASKAMQALITSGCMDDHVGFSKWCYEIADKMLAEREK